MFLDRFSVRVEGGHEDTGGYVLMPHGGKYKLRLRNERNTPADAEVSVDGKLVGAWRVNAHSSIVLERPADDHGQFTFYELGTPEASFAGLNAEDTSVGLISVRFRPGRVMCVRPLAPQRVRPLDYPWRPWYPWLYTPWQWWTETSTTTATATWNSRCFAVNENASHVTVTCSAPVAASAGGTGLSGYSTQEFNTVANLQYDDAQDVTINLRLVCNKNVEAIRPLRSVSTPVPAPIGSMVP